MGNLWQVSNDGELLTKPKAVVVRIREDSILYEMGYRGWIAVHNDWFFNTIDRQWAGVMGSHKDLQGYRTFPTKAAAILAIDERIWSAQGARR